MTMPTYAMSHAKNERMDFQPDIPIELRRFWYHSK